MSGKINAELSQRLKQDEPTGKEVPVIITVKENADLDSLKKNGLKINHIYQNINAVSGTLPASAVKSIAKLDEVERIEFDGEVHALSEEVDSQ
ncbi:MAG: protease inhibitor I9 family protein [Acidobacteriota bacterium]|nr:protease inhibitor I9 family protein [Acidobacteriota bacterium]